MVIIKVPYLDLSDDEIESLIPVKHSKRRHNGRLDNPLQEICVRDRSLAVAKVKAVELMTDAWEDTPYKDLLWQSFYGTDRQWWSGSNRIIYCWYKSSVEAFHPFRRDGSNHYSEFTSKCSDAIRSHRDEYLHLLNGENDSRSFHYGENYLMDTERVRFPELLYDLDGVPFSEFRERDSSLASSGEDVLVENQQRKPSSFIANRRPSDRSRSPLGRGKHSSRGDRYASIIAASVSKSLMIAALEIDERWLYDSGCARDLVARLKVARFKQRWIEVPVEEFDTAHGPTTANHVIPMTLLCIEDEMAPLIMENSPSVLSMGRRNMHCGYSFFWVTGLFPVVLTPNKTLFPLDIISDIPFIQKGGIHTRVRDPDELEALTGIRLTDTGVNVRNLYDLVPPPPAAPATPRKGRRSDTGKRSTSASRKSSQDDGPDVDPSSDEDTTAGSDVVSDMENSSGGDSSSAARVRESLYDDEFIKHTLTHKPARRHDCWSCLKGKTRFLRKIRNSSKRKPPKKFGDLFTFDHIYMRDWYGQPGLGNFPDILNSKDIATKYRHAEPVSALNELDTFSALNQIRGDDVIKRIYSDNFKSYRNVIRRMGCMWEQSQPGIHQTNAVIEQDNLDLLNGIRCLLVLAGLPACFWTYAAPHYTFLHNTYLEDNGETPYFLRHAEHFEGKRLTFGCAVYFKPSPTKYTPDKAEPTMQTGILVGYRLAPGGIWNGEYVVMDLDDFAGKDLSQDSHPSNFNQIYPHRTKQVEITELGSMHFPLQNIYNWYNNSLEGRTLVHDSSKFSPPSINEMLNYVPVKQDARKCMGFMLGDGVAMQARHQSSHPNGPNISPDVPVISQITITMPGSSRDHEIRQGDPIDVIRQNRMGEDSDATVEADDDYEIESNVDAAAPKPLSNLFPMAGDPTTLGTELPPAQTPPLPPRAAEYLPYEGPPRITSYKCNAKDGRAYPYDQYGNRVTKHYSNRPPNIPSAAWRKLSTAAKTEAMLKYGDGSEPPVAGPCVKHYGNHNLDDVDALITSFESDIAHLERGYTATNAAHAQICAAALGTTAQKSKSRRDRWRDDHICPAMPCIPHIDGHRQKYGQPTWLGNWACVAQPVTPKQMESLPSAQQKLAYAARDKEWNNLGNKNVWIWSSVREWDSVAAEARNNRQEIHMGRLFGLCVIKVLN